MTDFLIVHDVGQGAWFWNKVWGSVTAPEEHPPRLYTPRSSSQFYLLNLPGHGGDEEGDTGEVRLDECIQAITRAVERRGMSRPGPGRPRRRRRHRGPGRPPAPDSAQASGPGRRRHPQP